LVSKFASEKVKVALSADAGDELFCGYSGYALLASYYKTIRKIPSFAFGPLSFLLSMFSPDFLAGTYGAFQFTLPKYDNVKGKIYKFKNILKYKGRDLPNLVESGYSFWLGYLITIAVEEIALAWYLQFFWPVDFSLRLAVAVAVGFVLTLANFKGVKLGSEVEDWLTVGKLAPLVLLIVVGMFFFKPANIVFPAFGGATISPL